MCRWKNQVLRETSLSFAAVHDLVISWTQTWLQLLSLNTKPSVSLVQTVWIVTDHSKDEYTYFSLIIQLFTFQLPQDSQEIKLWATTTK